MAQLPRRPRIPKLNMSVSSAYFPIIFFSLVPSLLFNALLLAYPYHLLVRGEQRDLIVGLSMTPCTLLLPPVPPAAIPTLPSFLFPLSLSLPDHATHRACCFVYPLRTFTARNGKNCSPFISINEVYGDKRGVNVIKLDRYVPNVSLLRSHSLMHHFIRLLTT